MEQKYLSFPNEEKGLICLAMQEESEYAYTLRLYPEVQLLFGL